MRSYQLYLLEDEVVSRYYGQEIKLFNLFCERFQANLTLKPLLTKQVEYITKPIPLKGLTNVLTKEDHYLSSDRINTSTYRMAHQPSESWIDVKLRDHYLLVTAFGEMEVETRLFERLKEMDSHFFAVNVGQRRFGWLGPIKKVQGF